MTRLEELARAAIGGDALLTRSLAQDWLADHPRLADVPPPEGGDARVRVVAAALVELFALRRGEPAPAWAAGIGALDEPLFLVRQAATLPRLRQLCERDAPEPLRRRAVFAPPDYLSAA